MKKPNDIDKQVDSLSKKERKIYDAILSSFPATSKEYAYDAAINGGVKFQFISK